MKKQISKESIVNCLAAILKIQKLIVNNEYRGREGTCKVFDEHRLAYSTITAMANVGLITKVSKGKYTCSGIHAEPIDARKVLQELSKLCNRRIKEKVKKEKKSVKGFNAKPVEINIPFYKPRIKREMPAPPVEIITKTQPENQPKKVRSFLFGLFKITTY